MTIPASFLDELRQRIGLADLIGRKVKLIKRGREYKGLCPFHNEKTPSFTVNEGKGFFHCFGCGAHGDIIAWLMQREGLTFIEAVERLAQDAGLSMPTDTPHDRARHAKRASLIDINEAAQRWFARQLAGRGGARAQTYLADRRLNPDSVSTFGLGYAPPDRRGLMDALTARGLQVADLVDAGVLVRPEDGGRPYDRFRNRLMFPIRDRRGRVIAFGGRALDDAPAKYLNSSETPIFSKRHTLYNLDLARQEAFKSARIIVAEGYTDVISLHQNGFLETVAPLGTALTEDHMLMLWKLAPEPLLCFDGDAAGKRAANRAAELALPLLKPGHSLRFVLLPSGDDPDSFVQGRGGPAFQTVLDQAVGLSDLVWAGLTATADISTPERRAGLRDRAMDLVSRIRQPDVQQFYKREFYARLDELFGFGSNRNGRARSAPHKPRSRSFADPSRPRPPRPAVDTVPRLALLTVANHPALLPDFDEQLAQLDFGDPALVRLRQRLLSLAGEKLSDGTNAIRDRLAGDPEALTLERLERDPLLAAHRFARIDAADAISARRLSHLLDRYSHATTLERELGEAKAAAASETTQDNWNHLQALTAAARQAREDLVSVLAEEPGTGTGIS